MIDNSTDPTVVGACPFPHRARVGNGRCARATIRPRWE